MADLIAIGYGDEETAAKAADEARRLAADLIIQPDAIAVIVCNKDGKYQVTTSHHPVGAGASYGMFWGMLFGLLFFVPVFGMAIGAGLGALMGKIEKTGIDRERTASSLTAAIRVYIVDFYRAAAPHPEPAETVPPPRLRA